MKTGFVRALAVLALLAAAGSCSNDDDEQTQTHPGKLTQDANLDEAPPCDVETQCPEGLECIVLDIEPALGPLCLEPGIACELLDCGESDCLLLESYPERVTCAGTSSGDDGDDPVSTEPDGP